MTPRNRNIQPRGLSVGATLRQYGSGLEERIRTIMLAVPKISVLGEMNLRAGLGFEQSSDSCLTHPSLVRLAEAFGGSG
jgi:hypothetical protein